MENLEFKKKFIVLIKFDALQITFIMSKLRDL